MERALLKSAWMILLCNQSSGISCQPVISKRVEKVSILCALRYRCSGNTVSDTKLAF